MFNELQIVFSVARSIHYRKVHQTLMRRPIQAMIAAAKLQRVSMTPWLASSGLNMWAFVTILLQDRVEA